MVFDRLKRADWLAELFPRLGKAYGKVARAPRNAKQLRRSQQIQQKAFVPRGGDAFGCGVQTRHGAPVSHRRNRTPPCRVQGDQPHLVRITKQRMRCAIRFEQHVPDTAAADRQGIGVAYSRRIKAGTAGDAQPDRRGERARRNNMRTQRDV